MRSAVAFGAVEVERVTHRRGRMEGVHATLKTAQGELAVALGPSWFIDTQALALSAKDKVTVTGSRVDLQGVPTLIATEVRRGEQVLTLRDASGVPVWAAARRGR